MQIKNFQLKIMLQCLALPCPTYEELESYYFSIVKTTKFRFSWCKFQLNCQSIKYNLEGTKKWIFYPFQSINILHCRGLIMNILDFPKRTSYRKNFEKYDFMNPKKINRLESIVIFIQKRAKTGDFEVSETSKSPN